MCLACVRGLQLVSIIVWACVHVRHLGQPAGEGAVHRWRVQRAAADPPAGGRENGWREGNG